MAEGWNYADIWEAVADRFPDETAQITDDRTITWGDFSARADGVALALVEAGLGRQGKVAQYLYNCPEFLESMFGCFKAGLAPVNTNYRYTDDELEYLWDNADAEAVVFHAEFAETCDRLRVRLPNVRAWICVGGPALCPPWAAPYEEVARGAHARVTAPHGRSGDDLYLIYTGGTTGSPKGVMWRQDDLFQKLEAMNGRVVSTDADAVGYVGRLAHAGPRVLPAAPLMHGTAAWFALQNLCQAGSTFTLPNGGFDPAVLLRSISEYRIKGMAIVGDAFAKPILAELEANPDRYDLSSLRVIISSGVMLSSDSKQRLHSHVPKLILVDSLGASESGGIGKSTTTDADTATFEVSSYVRVIDDSGNDLSGEVGGVGRLAVGGHLPLGYYKDPEKSATTFVELGGRRHVITGDLAEIQADGSIRLLGRGSNCINTGGEKVYPEEVEEALKLHPDVRDAAVIGLADERFGEAVTAIIELRPGAQVGDDQLVAHVKEHLAGYKAPKSIVRLDSIQRQANGKVNYQLLKTLALRSLAGPS
jgi:acyl-CoA synthetase (AMP-forming)/AMP-acid ligase II